MKKFFSLIIVFQFVVALAVGSAVAKSPRPELNLSSSGLALRGFDPVSYFKQGKPVKGSSKIFVKNGGGKYYFSSEENKQAFLKNPNKYLPAYGGYCSYGTAVKAKVDGNPSVWHIVNGKLYLNINRSVDRTWNKKRGTYIKRANRNWPKLRKR